MLNAAYKLSRCPTHRRLCCVALSFLFVLGTFANTSKAQRERGELQIEVHDPQGQSAAAVAELISESNQLKKNFAIAADGKYLASELVFGVYRLTVTAQG